MAAEIEPLAESDGAKRIHARTVRLPPPEQRQACTAATDLDAQSPRGFQGGMAAQRGAYGEKDEPAFFCLVDNLERESASATNAIEKQFAVSSFTDRTRRNRSNPRNTVRVDDVAKALESAEGGIGSFRPDHAARKRIATQEDTTRGLFHNLNRPAGGDLGDDESNGARTHVQHGDQLARHSLIYGHFGRPAPALYQS
jgi:hypothetical protein